MKTQLNNEIKDCLGVLPNFFRLAPESPDIAANLWGFARFAYLDNPLPSLFKERLFVYLSRFCDVRYCIARHVGFLVGLGHPSADHQCPAQTVEDIISLLRRPFPRAEHLEPYVSQCAACDTPLAELPEPDSAMEEAIFGCSTHAFLQTPDAPRCLDALKHVLGESRFQHLMVFLAFVRTAHFWTKTHTELILEDDIKRLLATHEILAECVLNDPESEACEMSQKLVDELQSLREQKELLALESEARSEAETLNKLACTLAAELDLETLVQQVTDAGIELTGAKFGAFFYNSVNEQGEVYLLYTLSGAPREAFEKFGVPRNTEVFEPTFRGVGVVRIDDVLRDPRYGKMPPHHGMPKGHLPVRSYLAAPVVSRSGDVLGGLFFGHPEPCVFKERAERLIVGMAAQAAIAMDNAKLYGEAQKEIAQRKEAEQALRASEGRNRAILAQAIFGVAVTDLKGRFVEVNDAYCKITGYTEQELLATDFPAITHPEDRETNNTLFRQMLAAEIPGFTIEKRYVRKDGGHAWGRNAVSLIRDTEQRPANIVALSYDITDRKRAEQELRCRTDELTAFFENATIGLHWVGPDGIIQWANPAELEMLGYIKEEYQGHHIAEFHADQEVIEDILARSACGEKLKDYEARLRCKNGSIRQVLIDSSVLWDKERFVHTQCFTRDITDRKRMEEELQTLNTELENRVLERTSDLHSSIAQREKLQEQLLQAQKMESIGTLAGGIAHDFNNLLNIIMGYTLLIQHNAHQGELSEALTVIRETVQRAAALVQQLLAIARKTETTFEQVNINAILEKLNLLLRETLPKAIDISLELHAEIPALMADANQIHQLLLNLCVNARDAMPEGGKLLLETSIVDSAELRQSFQDAKEERYVCIRVTDTGIGIDEVTKSRIFEPFFTTKPQGHGTGLGLSVVYGIIASHSGFVDVKSVPNQGTDFRIYLPIPRERIEFIEIMPKPGGNNKPERPAGHGETVLFVDDEEKQLRLMREFLESERYRVLLARDGAEAVDVHAHYKEEIAIVVLDLGLPKLNGWQAFQRMRKIDPKLNALFATGYLSPEIEAEVKKDQLAAVISKPYQLNEILEKIAAALQKLQVKPSPE